MISNQRGGWKKRQETSEQQPALEMLPQWFSDDPLIIAIREPNLLSGRSTITVGFSVPPGELAPAVAGFPTFDRT